MGEETVYRFKDISGLVRYFTDNWKNVYGYRYFIHHEAAIAAYEGPLGVAELEFSLENIPWEELKVRCRYDDGINHLDIFPVSAPKPLTNKKRAARAKALVDWAQRMDGIPPSSPQQDELETIIDVLANIAHLLAQRGLDPEFEFQAALGHFFGEESAEARRTKDGEWSGVRTEIKDEGSPNPYVWIYGEDSFTPEWARVLATALLEGLELDAPGLLP